MDRKKEEMTNPNAKLSEEEFVKSIHSGALAAPSGVDGGLWVIYDPDNGGIIYGSDYRGEREAWADAASRLRAEEGIGEAYGYYCDVCSVYHSAVCPEAKLNQSDEGKPTESAQQEPAETPDILNIGHISYGEFKKACEQHGVEMPPFVVWAAIASIAKIASPSTPVSAPQDELLEVLWKAEAFIEDELNVRKQSFLPEGSPYIDQAQTLLDLVSSTIAKAVGQEETKK